MMLKTSRISKSEWFARDSFKFDKRSQLFIRLYNEPLSVAAVRICNPDRSPVGINR
jgi:hypothetical protein